MWWADATPDGELLSYAWVTDAYGRHYTRGLERREATTEAEADRVSWENVSAEELVGFFNREAERDRLVQSLPSLKKIESGRELIELFVRVAEARQQELQRRKAEE